MFTILQKGQDVINVEDLDTLQTEIETSLVNVMQKKWQLETDLQVLIGNNPQSSEPNSSDINSNHQNASSNSNNHRRTNNLSSASSVNYSSASSNCSVSSDNSVEGSVLSGTTNTTSTTVWTESSHVASSQSLSSKRNSRSTHDDKPSKRFKLESPSSFNKRPPHSKHRSKVVPNHNEDTPEVISKLAFRNDTPDKFWPFVEQFCAAPIVKEIQALEDMLKAYEEDKDYFRIPNLGRKNQANNKDSSNSTDQKGSPSKADSNNKNKSNNNNSATVTASPKSPNKSGAKSKGDGTHSNSPSIESNNKKSPSKSTSNRRQNNNTDEEACLGALTQRLVSCLIEENMNSYNEVEADFGFGTSMPGSNSNNSNNKKNHKFRNFDLGNVKLLEKRIRTTLEEHHILTKQDDISFCSEDDDVLRELRCCQNELSLIQTYNKEAIVSLIARAKRRADLEQMRNKLSSANADVIDSYLKLIQAKQKKRNPTKKEKEAAWKAIEEQQVIFRRCEELGLG